MSIATFSVRVDTKVKREAEDCLERLGLNMSSAINIYLRQIVRRQAIPFEISAELYIPNHETQAAIEEGERQARDSEAQGYKDMKSLLAALNS